MLNVRAVLKTLIRYTPKIAYGRINNASTGAQVYKDFNVTFAKAFKNVPVVVACFESTSTGAGFGSCTVAVNNVTTTGCKIRVFNSDSTTRAPHLLWLAVDVTNWGGYSVIRSIFGRRWRRV